MDGWMDGRKGRRKKEQTAIRDLDFPCKEDEEEESEMEEESKRIRRQMLMCSRFNFSRLMENSRRERIFSRSALS